MTITLTKARLAVAIVAIAALVPATAYATSVFEDVPDGKFYAAPVAWAFDNDITTGKTPTQFDPEGNVTRGESVTFLKRYDDNIVQPALDDLADDLTTADAGIDAVEADLATAEADIEAVEAAVAAIPSGVTGHETIYGDAVSVDDGGYGTATATCPAGKVVVGGGYTTIDGIPHLNIFREWPDGSTGWQATAYNGSGFDGRRFYAWAICVDAAS